MPAGAGEPDDIAARGRRGAEREGPVFVLERHHARLELERGDDPLVVFSAGRWLAEQLLNDLVGALELLRELLRADEVLLVARSPGHDSRKLWRDFDIGAGGEVLGPGHDLLAFAAQDEIREQHGGVRMP